MKFLIYILILSTLLFGYQKGDIVDKEIQEKLSLDQNKIYIIDFFASWCPSCKKEMPYISKINSTIDQNKINIIGVCVDEDIKDGQKFQKELREANALNFRVIDDPKGEIIKKFDPVGMPALFFIKNFKVVDSIIGAKSNIDEKILTILKGLE